MSGGHGWVADLVSKNLHGLRWPPAKRPTPPLPRRSSRLLALYPGAGDSAVAAGCAAQ